MIGSGIPRSSNILFTQPTIRPLPRDPVVEPRTPTNANGTIYIHTQLKYPQERYTNPHLAVVTFRSTHMFRP